MFTKIDGTAALNSRTWGIPSFPANQDARLESKKQSVFQTKWALLGLDAEKVNENIEIQAQSPAVPPFFCVVWSRSFSPTQLRVWEKGTRDD